MPWSESDSFIPVLAFLLWNAKIGIIFLDSGLGIPALKCQDRNQIPWIRSWHFRFGMSRSGSDSLIPFLAFQLWRGMIGIKFLESDLGISGLKCQGRNQIPWFRSGISNFKSPDRNQNPWFQSEQFQVWNPEIRISFLDSDLGISGLKCRDRNQTPWLRSWHFRFEVLRS